MRLINEINIKKLHQDAIIPSVSTDGSGCFDLYCCKSFTLENGSLELVSTGLSFEVHSRYHVEIYPRSSMSKRGIIIPNSPGIIDSDYRGEILVMLYGLFMVSSEHFEVGSKVAQFRLVNNVFTHINEVDSLSDTVRGSGGFGSTGK